MFLSSRFEFVKEVMLVEKSRVDEPELGKLERDKMVLDKLEVGFDVGRLFVKVPPAAALMVSRCLKVKPL
uniref:Uncharacterized protein n=1 Tax=Tanacetum cinerariifolium TaxID=118510 RepID=A0A699SIX2_TANCI|nr:hypothetical protein [Tanacetum cinerariifolium]